MENQDFQLRGLLSSKEASTLIGKNGANIQSIRESAQVTIGVSKQTKSTERVVTVKGQISNVATVEFIYQGFRFDCTSFRVRSASFKDFDCPSIGWFNYWETGYEYQEYPTRDKQIILTKIQRL